ncbi:Pentatricopeptide repeat [Macleaya cordata]|uniref:Pentatricopeptide repeat n=1 Tax=Macleaya cordata TaxID=56857 RepID=A0A200PTD9_MACCD|nr:Pentatricopeptide repeat [Macleaya cordata]
MILLMNHHVYKLHARLIKTGLLHTDPLHLRELLLISCATSAPESLPYARSIIFDCSISSLSSLDTFTWNTIIRAYSNSSSPSESLTLFSQMHRIGISPDHFTFPFLLKSCSRLRRGGQQLHSLILKLGFVDYDIFVQNSLIHFYGSSYKSVDSALKLFDEMPVKDLVSWSSMIACFTNNGFYDEALSLFREMQLRTNLKPDEVTMVIVLSAVSSLGALELGRWVHLFIEENRLNLTVSMGTALIDMYSRCGSIEEAIKVFDKMPKRNVFTWTALIGGLAVHGRSKEALRMFYELNKSGLKPDSVTFVGVLVACSHGGLLEDGWKVFESIKNEYCMEPRLEHYGCMVDLLGRAGLLNEAYQFIEKMPIEPNSIVWRTLLGACVNYGDIELAKQVNEKISVLDPYHDGDHVLLSNVYGGVNRWIEKASVRNSMREKRVVKNPGWSLIEVDQVIHEFVAGDDSHPRFEEIREVMGTAIERLKLAGYAPDTSSVLFDIEDEEKERNLSYHSEKLAVAFALLSHNDRKTIRVMKNLRICRDCHCFMKLFSEVFERDIIVRDRNRFHHFSKGLCSCRDYW